ncbi:uncharacterized protein LOC108683295 [Hyalella azteca]|uniref:Uncharacterized protein LOC108683295 n=1 Tax=Hyalella azteca TaxID=294128 RepID=A0A8B7PQ11_HYAAZ|nr:uncharacterized protein LOC108683295 [Hyalella azteca]
MSHSAGGHMVCSYLQLSGCENFKGMALTSPVDGVDPFGVVDDYCTSLDSTLNFSIPTIVMAAGLDDVPGSNLTSTTCAPADMSNMRFYRALDPDSPRWFLNATEFGHFDYCNLLFQEAAAVSHFCATNREAGLLEFSKYRSFVPGTAVAFFFSLLEDDCQTYLPYLQDTSAMPVAVVGEYVNQEEATGRCPRGYCSRVPSVDQN